MPRKPSCIISALYMTTIVSTAILTPALTPYTRQRLDEKECRKALEKVRRNQKREERKRALQLETIEREQKERDRMERMTDEEYFGWMS
jgi:hypothetical protein